MFLGFKIEDNINFEDYYDEGKQMYDSNLEEMNKHLDDYLFDGTDVINADEVESDWFPTLLDIDVFLSHSHRDKDKAMGFAGWLNHHFGLKVFIDSCVWNHADDLLMQIDKNYCKFPGTDTYDYQKRNYSTSHVHMMLSIALTKMIDQSEITIFMDTENSTQEISETIDKTVKSPWIYSELVMTDLVRKKIPQREWVKKAQEKPLLEQRDFKIARDVSLYLDKLIPLSKSQLEGWIKEYKQQSRPHWPLDFLYLQYEGIYNIIYKREE
ncbi:hypothetical protein CHL76_15665 [Marinococcus halophilus]|uniref:TIR domain-containing protein n=2 Tax=Marinococcus halophilus TaxID=1371 RepID=A0A510Y9Q5_MARHA|nr:hypothetical protein [Marinococcus halophilus]OZT78874.1 hypothetical protein CHL76_15665 [Marinococcus halophilus]GEK60114.1 hypothetical protein MHA01_30190 [Marinococcus halophilus]